MDIRAVAFDVNGTLVKILADDHEERIFRAAAHFLTYQGIELHRHELRELYFQIMKEQLRSSPEKYPVFDAVGIWRSIIEDHKTDFTRALPAGQLQQIPLFLAEMARGISRQEQRDLLELASWQGAGEIRLVIFDDAAPDADGVEFGVLLRAAAQLLLHDLEIELTELVPVQLDALVGEEVRRGPENPLVAVIGQDPDQGAVHVESDGSDVHTLASGFLVRQGVVTSLDRQRVGTDARGSGLGVQAACSILFACRTSLRP